MIQEDDEYGYFPVVGWVVYMIIYSVHLFYIYYRFIHGTYLHMNSSRKVEHLVIYKKICQIYV